MIVLVVLVYILLILIDLVPLYKDKLFKDFWTSTVLCSVSFIAFALVSFNIKIPSPAKGLKDIVLYIFQK